MQKLVLALIVILRMGIAPLHAADFQKAVDAYNNGDFATAVKEWQPLAEQGVASAQYNLALMYNTGKGVAQDDKAAVKWFRLAAEQGNVSAQHNLALSYNHGIGVAQNYKAAVKWYKLAAEHGNASAQVSLGVMYATGRGVLLDDKTAYMWFNLSGANGNKGAFKGRDMVAARMTQADISKAQDMSRACLANNYKNCGN